MKISISTIVMSILMMGFSFGQSKIFIQKNRYNRQIQSNSKFTDYKFLGGYYIDRNRKNIIDKNQVREGLNKIFPDKEAFGILCVDLENKLYLDLKKNGNSSDFRNALTQFCSLVDFIKNLRPNVKVGIYGMPFSFNYKFQKDVNNFSKIKPLLDKVDFISPSLYMAYSEQQYTDEMTKSFIESNLSLFLDYSKKANKPLYLYVWYKIHPSNKKYGLTNMSNKRMNLYLNTISNFRYDGRKVDGLIWWEPSVRGGTSVDINDILESNFK